MNYYPGCFLHGSAREYDASVREVCHRMGWELTELEDWSCCGAGVVAAADPAQANAIPLRNLALAEERGEELFVPCAACYNRLQQAQVGWSRRAPATMEGQRLLVEATGRRYGGGVRVRHLLDWWTEPERLSALQQAVVRPWTELRLAAYYGCLLVRPREIACDDPEQPRRMETLLAAVGTHPVDWSGRLECCGGSQALVAEAATRRLVSRLVQEARAAGAQALVTACPMCQANLDTYQEEPGLPVLFLSEVVAGALGADVRPWLRGHLVPAAEVLLHAE